MQGLRTVFTNWRYLLLALIVSVVIFTVAVWIPNTQLIIKVIPDHTINALDKANLLASLFGSIATNFTVVSASYTIAIAVLFGMNVALFTHYIRSRKGMFEGKSTAAGIGGLISGMFGIGCAACGTFILTWVLGIIGAASLISFLPLGGEEFGILGVILLVFSVYMTALKIQEVSVCEI